MQCLALLKKNEAAQHKERTLCGADFWRFATGWVITKDEKAPTRGKSAFRRFPTKVYLRIVAETLLENPLLILEKTRQMMASWLISAICVWDLLFSEGIQDHVQRMNRIKTRGLLSRMRFILEHLPRWMIRGELRSEVERIRLMESYSEIIGWPEGSEHSLGEVATRVIIDEGQECKTLEDTLNKALPMAAGLWVICTADVRARHLSGLIENSGRPRALGKGLSVRDGKHGFKILRMRYPADPDKDPDTYEGMAWYAAERLKFSDTAWEQFYEINWKAAGGNRMLPTFEYEKHTVEGLRPTPGRPFLRGWDFGYHWPRLVVSQMNSRDQLCVLREFRLKEVTFKQFLAATKEWFAREFPPRPGEEAPVLDYIDPAGSRRTHRSDQTDAELMSWEGMSPAWRQSSERQRTNIILNLLAKREDGLPGILFDRRCEELIDGALGAYVESPVNPDEAQNVHPYVDVFDALGYILVNIFDPVLQASRPARDPTEEEAREEMLLEEDLAMHSLDTGPGWDYSLGRY